MKRSKENGMKTAPYICQEMRSKNTCVKLKNRKAGGEDGIRNKMLKTNNKIIIQFYHELYDKSSY